MLDPATGTANPSFHPQPNASVLKMALSGRTLYLGGKFTSVAGMARVRLAAVDAITGGLGTKLTLAPNAAVRDLALNTTGSTLYLAGSFTKIGTTTRYNFASVGTASRALTAWNPNIRLGLGHRAVAQQHHRLHGYRRWQRERLQRRSRVGDRHAGHRVGHAGGPVAQRWRRRLPLQLR